MFLQKSCPGYFTEYLHSHIITALTCIKTKSHIDNLSHENPSPKLDKNWTWQIFTGTCMTNIFRIISISIILLHVNNILRFYQGQSMITEGLEKFGRGWSGDLSDHIKPCNHNLAEIDQDLMTSKKLSIPIPRLQK